MALNKNIRIFMRVLLMLLCLFMLASCKSAGDEAASAASVPAETAVPSGEPAPAVTVTVDRPAQELVWGMDTLINYTVTTPDNCVSVHIGQRASSWNNINNDMNLEGTAFVTEHRVSDPERYVEIYNEQSFTRADARVTETDGGLVWELPVDFGFSCLYGASVRAVMSDGTELAAVADAYIRYHEHDVFGEGLCSVWESYILQNSTDPYYFVADLADSGIDYINHPTNHMCFLMTREGSAHFCLPIGESEKLSMEERIGVYPSNPWDTWLKYNSPVYGETALVRPYESCMGILALNWFGGSDMAGLMPPYGDYLLGVIEGEGADREYIYPATRAAVCYKYGVAPDAEKFPEAAYIYERGSEILGGILNDGMSEYDKVKAIHDWMLADGREHTQSGDFKKLTAEEQDHAATTCYGFLMGYGGDCMGWSDTFRVLCGMAGIRCSGVSCYSGSGGAVDEIDIFDHRFNVATLDGEPYYFDVFWDGAGSGYDKPPYTYFAMTTEEAAKSHTWLSYESWGPQDATAAKYQTDPVTGALING